MRHKVSTGVFEPRPTITEKKSEATARIAQQIIDNERSAREEKTRRLRRARLAESRAEPMKTSATTGARSGRHSAT
jgi:hypothetical protein